VLVTFGVNLIACWALDLQLGTTGILNFAFIVFQAVGAYVVGVLTLGAPSGAQTYIIGAHLPFLVALLAATAVGGALALPVALISFRRLRADYEAIVMLTCSLIATQVVESATGFLNGSAGLSLIPAPFATALGLSSFSTTYQWIYVGFTAAVCCVVYLIVHRLTESPFGRALRALRENEGAAVAIGKDVTRLRLLVFVTGGALAALSGGLFVGFLGAWSPASWLYPETFVYLTAIIIGGRGNKLGALLGAFLVPGFSELSEYFSIGNPTIVGALQWMVIGALILVFLYFWPRGILPERRRKLSREVDRSSTEIGVADG
jgi:branched-chain amino acid transport system permease protein